MVGAIVSYGKAVSGEREENHEVLSQDIRWSGWYSSRLPLC